MKTTPPRTHRNLLANAVADPTLGNLPQIVRSDVDDDRRKIEDFQRMIDRMGGVDNSLSCIHISQMAGLRERFQARVAGDDWREHHLHFSLAATVELAEVLEEMDILWCHWRKPDHPVDNGLLLLELVDLSSVFMDQILQDIPVAEFAPVMDPNTIAYKLGDIVNATWNAHYDVMSQEGVHQSDESAVMLGYLVELRQTVAENNPIEGLGVIGAMLAMLGLNPNDLYGWFLGKNVLNLFRQDNGYMQGTYFKRWGAEQDVQVLARILRLARSTGYKTVSDQDGKFVYETLKEAYVKSFE